MTATISCDRIERRYDMQKEQTWKKEARRAAAKVSRQKLGRRMAYDLQERRQWTASCRLEWEEMERLIELCEEQGTTRYALIKAMVREYIKANS